MSFLPPGDDASFEDDLPAELDAGVIDRLSAYGADGEPVGSVDALEDDGPREPPSWTGDPAEPPAFHAPEPVRDDETEPKTAELSPLDVDPERVEVEPVAVEESLVEPDVAPAEPSAPEVVQLASGATEAAELSELAESDDDPQHATELADPLPEQAPLSEPRRRRALRGRRHTSGEDEAQARNDGKREKHKNKKAKRLVGLKIGASQIAAAQVVNNGAPELVGLWREPLEPGVVVFGEIRDPDALGDALKEFFAVHKLPKRGIRLGISNNRVGVRIFDVDGVSDPSQLENAIRFRAEEVLPIPLDQAVLDYAILDESTFDEGTPRKRILLVVAYREVVERYLQACSRAGLQVAGIDHEAFALLRSLELPEERSIASGALVAVAIGHDRTTIAVSTGRHCEFARVLDWGGWSLNVAIARELNRAPSEVEQVKRQLSFARETPIEGLDAMQVGKARDGMKRALDAFARELVSSLQFYQAQPGAFGIGEVALTGGTAHMDGLPEALGEIIGVPIRLGDPFKRLKVGAKVEQHFELGSLAIAIGLGIED